jgi:tetratricopeptide (TPR) repeat protein
MAQASHKQLQEKARVLRAAGRDAEAVDVLQEAVAAEPGDLITQHNLASALGDIGRYKEAVAVLKPALKQGLDAPESWLVYARALVGIADFENGETAYRTVLTKNPVNGDAHRELAQLVWMRTADNKAALAALDAALAANPAEIVLRVLKAEIVGQMGDRQGQYTLITEALNATGGDIQVAHYACKAALTCGEFQAALAYGEQTTKAYPNDVGFVASYIEALLALGEAKIAEGVIEDLRRHHPDNQLVIALQATAWRLLGDDRYGELYDYDAFVCAAPMARPNGWSTMTAYLDDLVEELDQAHSYVEHPFFQSVRHGSQLSSINLSDSPAMGAFEEAAYGPLTDYIGRLGEGTDPLRARNKGGFHVISAWSIRLSQQGFHVNHVHPEGWLSFACHIRPPADDPANPNAGCLKLGEPGCATSPTLAPERFVKPQAGTGVIFPSYMWHGTVEYAPGPARTTIAADIGPQAG